MNIGIITFHFVENYGAVLQAYALQQYLLEQGHIVKIIDYRPRSLTDVYKLFDKYFLETLKNGNLKLKCKLIIYYFITLPYKIRKKLNFQIFVNKYLKLTDRVTDFKSINQVSDQFDILICGSDQIWNNDITNGYDCAYFLEFGTEKQRKISYAASMGKSTLSKDEKIIFANYLKDFSLISVREKDTADKLGSFIDNVYTVCDPVFLLTKDQWVSNLKIRKNSDKENKYILEYTLEDDDRVDEISKQLSTRHNIKIKKINLYKMIKNNNYTEHCGVSPREFISLIYNSEYVVTNSFHATAFAILLHKKLYVVHHKTRGNRTANLLKSLNLEQLAYENLPKQYASININWKIVDDKINMIRQKSTELLEINCKKNNQKEHK